VAFFTLACARNPPDRTTISYKSTAFPKAETERRKARMRRREEGAIGSAVSTPERDTRDTLAFLPVVTRVRRERSGTMLLRRKRERGNGTGSRGSGESSQVEANMSHPKLDFRNSSRLRPRGPQLVYRPLACPRASDSKIHLDIRCIVPRMAHIFCDQAACFRASRIPELCADFSSRVKMSGR